MRIKPPSKVRKSDGVATSLWRRLHRWIGLSIAVALLPVSVTGSLLVWREHVDALLSPRLFAVSGKAVSQPLSRYLETAAAAAPASYALANLRMPYDDGWPVTAIIRKTPLQDAADLERELVVYLDPPTAKVLGIANPRTSFTGTIRRLHRDFLVPDWSGRQIVGWIGVGMLLLTLSGLWLWWPRGKFLAGLRWNRSPQTSLNLHYSGGFWIVLPLAIVSATGIYLSFPQSARSLTASFAEFAPRELRADRNRRVTARLNADEITGIVQKQHPEARIVSLLLPLAYTFSRERDASQVLWQVQAITDGISHSFLIDDATAQLSILPALSGGNRVVRVVHHLHEGEGYSAIWRVAVFLTGILPPALAVTGLLMWLRTRKRRAKFAK